MAVPISEANRDGLTWKPAPSAVSGPHRDGERGAAAADAAAPIKRNKPYATLGDPPEASHGMGGIGGQAPSEIAEWSSSRLIGLVEEESLPLLESVGCRQRVA